MGKASVLQSTALCAAERRQSLIVGRNEQRTQVADLATRRAGCNKNKVQYAQVAQLGKASVLQSTALCAAERRQSLIVGRNEQRTQVADLATRRAGCNKNKVQYAQVAQSVEQRTENPRVGGSIPPLGTI